MSKKTQIILENISVHPLAGKFVLKLQDLEASILKKPRITEYKAKTSRSIKGLDNVYKVTVRVAESKDHTAKITVSHSTREKSLIGRVSFNNGTDDSKELLKKLFGIKHKFWREQT